MTDSEKLDLILTEVKDIKHSIDKIEQRMDNLEQRMNYLEQRMDKLEQRMDKLEQRMDKLEQRMDKLEQRMDKLEQRTDKLEQRMDKLEQRMDKLEQRTDIIEQHVDAMDKRTTEISLTIENETNHNIQLLAENHIDLIEKLNQSIKVSDKSLIFEVQVSGIKSRVDKLENEVAEIKSTIAQS